MKRKDKSVFAINFTTHAQEFDLYFYGKHINCVEHSNDSSCSAEHEWGYTKCQNVYFNVLDRSCLDVEVNHRNC